MTKKHFNALAEILREAHNEAKTTETLATVERIAADIARFCRTQNSNFDTARFIAATEAEK
jgi:hypothetical protein